MSDTSAAPAKTYDAQAREPHWYAVWEQQGVFQAEVNPDIAKYPKGPYSIVIPPPNVTGVLHMGHMLNNTIQDVLIRRKRSEGYNALWVPGTDHASIATETKVVRLLREQGTSKAQLQQEHGMDGGRDKFLEHAWAWKEKYGGIITEQLRRIGASVDWKREKFTMDADLSESVLAVFVDLYNKGLIYRAQRMVNWDPVGKTALSDEEVIYKEKTDKLYHVRYFRADQDGYIDIATTRPETIPADAAIAVNPQDERYKQLLEERAQFKVPITERIIPLISDNAVEQDFGTGALKITPAHDRTDYEIYLRAGEGLHLIDMLDDSGAVSHWDLPEPMIGLDRFEARSLFAEWLDGAGQLLKIEELRHNVGHSERTDSIIEPRLSLQWWVRMEHFAKLALDVVDNGEVHLVPDRFLNTYRYWLANIKDWCISRQLWWGHRIPAWYYKGLYFRKAQNPLLSEDDRYVIALSHEEAVALWKVKLPNVEVDETLVVQDEDVLDTWFSSWLWPISVFDNPVTKPAAERNADLNYFYPTGTLVTGPDILFFWVARMIMAGKEYMRDEAHPAGIAPFRDVYLTGIVRDKQGRKMSKSLGNSPDLFDLLDRYSVDGVRAGMLFSAPAGNDILFDEALCEQGRNFSNKIWNALKLVQMWGERQSDGTEAAPAQTLALDWLENRIAEVATELEGLFAQYRLNEALLAIYKLIWDDFCSWFLELSKPGMQQPFPAALYPRVIQAFEQLMVLLHPFMPFVTEEVWAALKPREAGDLCALARLPMFATPNRDLLHQMAFARELVTELRAFRADKKISMKEGLSATIYTQQQPLFEAAAPVLTKMVNLTGLTYAASSLQAQEMSVALAYKGSEIGFSEYVIADAGAERERLQAEITYTEGFLQQVQTKLANEKFVANAKPDLVERERQKLADAEAKLAALRQSLAALG